ncbi:hypothetical protein OG788_02285 [Streptomyces sp. NBC_00647]|uniref:hypothetical protein n=1 Tax=Streptomyces sp. NBC_00647 TaxID=2975796 RepID=UPI0032437FEC
MLAVGEAARSGEPSGCDGAGGAPACRGQVGGQLKALAGSDGLGGIGRCAELGRGEAFVESLQFGVGEPGTRHGDLLRVCGHAEGPVAEAATGPSGMLTGVDEDWTELCRDGLGFSEPWDGTYDT